MFIPNFRQSTAQFNWLGIILLASVLAITLFRIFHHFNTDKTGLLEDWLINYQDGGFKRRGLSGSLFFLVQDMTQLPLGYIFYGLELILNLSLFYYLFQLLRDRKMDPYFLLAFFSPVTLLFWINQESTLGRKETMLFLLFAYFLYPRA